MAETADERRRVVVFGDVIDDIVAVPRGEVRLDTDTPATIRFRAGGSAANAAAWLATAGTAVDFIGRVAAADLHRHTALFTEAGVTPHLSGDAQLPTGTIVIVVDGDHRNMLTERGANAALDPDAVTGGLLADARLLHLTGYSIFDHRDPSAFRSLIGRAIARGVPVSVDPGSAGYIDDYGVEDFLSAVDGATLVFPNLDEGRVLTGLGDPIEIAASLTKRFPVVALTLGAKGVVIAERGSHPLLVAVTESAVVDPTGAGDAFCAGFIHAWLDTRDAVASVAAGAALAANAVVTIGGRPHA